MSIRLLNESEINKMRVAGQLAASVLDMIGSHVKAGVSTEELDQICHEFIVKDLSCIPAPLNYRNGNSPPFPKSICTSVNHVVCHGIPSERKVLKRGDILNIDITVIRDGFHGDTSKMFTVGEPSVLAKRLINITQECLYLGIKQVRPGARLGDIGHAIQTHAERARFSVVREFCGHGINDKFHDEPMVLHYGNPGEGVELQPGMSFTIEPMINAGKRHIKLLTDEWTVVTRDHRLSAQWEHTLLVTNDGFEILTLRDEESFY
ncbi:MAG: type I methionyl aminopeptidase [Pseudomonadales bacterium]|nr:type I methionyl aminopeptidase [Pseudomonadales bacterium]